MRDRHNLLDSEKIRALFEKEIAYGILNDRPSSSILNHLILVGKYFLYSNALEENIKFNYLQTILILFMKKYVRVKKYIFVMTNTQIAFVKKWWKFLEWHILMLRVVE